MIAPSALRALAQQATPGRWVKGYWPLPEPTHYVGALSDDVFSSRMEAHVTGPVSEQDAAFIAACDPQTILALLDAVEAATDLITNAADSSRDVELEARRRLIAALAPFTETHEPEQENERGATHE